MILSQRLTFYLSDKIGKDTANNLMHDVAKLALKENISLKEAALSNKTIRENISENELNKILNPETYIGLAVEQAEMIIEDIKLKRAE